MFILHFSLSGGFLGLLKFYDYQEALATYNVLTKLGYVCYIREKNQKKEGN